MQITAGGGGSAGDAKKLINATVVLLFKLSGAFLGKLMCLQGDCRPGGDGEPAFPLPAPALAQGTGPPAGLWLGTSSQPPCTPTHTCTHCAELQHLLVGCRGLRKSCSTVARCREGTAGAQRRLPAEPACEGAEEGAPQRAHCCCD